MLRDTWLLPSIPSGGADLRKDLHATTQAIRQLSGTIESYFAEFAPSQLLPGELQELTTVQDLAAAIWKRIPEARKGIERPQKTSRGSSQRADNWDAHSRQESSGPIAFSEDEETSLVGDDHIYVRRRPGLIGGATENGKQKPRKGTLYSVWFGTDRKPIDESDMSKGFANERCGRTTLGRVDVLIPKAHRFGEMGSGLWKRLKRLDLLDDHISVYRTLRLVEEEFWTEVRERIRTAVEAGGISHALLYLHGYRTDFFEAARRAAQIGFDLKVLGAAGFFSWPSCNSLRGYAADEATIEASENAITNFIVDFAQKCGASKVHIVAHSMGNRGLLRALQRIAADAELRAGIRFGQLFLAAPDIDRDMFLDLAFLYKQFADRATLYASDGDKAVHLSGKHHRYPRAGYFPPYTVTNGVDTVAVPNFRIDLMGHAYYAKAAAMLNDMYDLLRNNTPPANRQRIEALQHGNQSLWRICL
jgi:esterase/lipase superfamily enzyme